MPTVAVAADQVGAARVARCWRERWLRASAVLAAPHQGTCNYVAGPHRADDTGWGQPNSRGYPGGGGSRGYAGGAGGGGGPRQYDDGRGSGGGGGNRFSSLGPGGGGGGGGSDYRATALADLQSERPLWLLSCYAIEREGTNLLQGGLGARAHARAAWWWRAELSGAAATLRSQGRRRLCGQQR